MSSHQQPSAGISYDPLPLTNDDHSSSALYNAPPSPHISNFNTPQMGSSDLPQDEAFIPPGAAQPRFMGSALYDNPSSPQLRESFTSSQRSLQSAPQSEYGSVYALNDGGASGRLGGYRDDPRDTYYADNVPMSPVGHSRVLEEKHATYAAPRAKSRKKIMIIGGIVAAILILAAIVVPLYFAVIKPKINKDSSKGSDSNHDKGGSSASASGGSVDKDKAAVTGGDGSTITMEDGTTFIYRNPFGGRWYYDPNDPFNNGAQAQSWTPALNETFHYGIDKIRGVNIGGWLNTEPFISPALYQKYLNNPTPAIDEWTLSEAMRADTAGGGIDQLETHYKTFITEKDFADIARAGLNYVRIPIAYWAIETRGNEPYLGKVSWNYFLKAIKWARKYGIRINLDLHTMPGSQNGWNHSGRLGTIGFLSGPMGYANAQRGLNYIRIFAEFISQPQYKDVVTMFGVMNEPLGEPMGKDQITRFYMEAYKIIRNAGGVGEGKGPWISLHDAFFSRDSWANVFPNADRLGLDTHPYLCFNGQSSDPMSSYANTPCTTWGRVVNESMSAFGLTTAGEFSNAVTDCGLFLNGVNLGTRYEGDYPGSAARTGSCTIWTDYTAYDDKTRQDIKKFTLASMDALQNYFFWTWKIGNSSASGRVETPAWSYQLGLEQGWMPTDPREADGTCGNIAPWQPPLQPWQTGGAGAGDIPASVTSAFAWPPLSINKAGPISLMPSYTPTGAIPTLTATPITAGRGEHITKTVDPGNGWNNAQDTQGVFVEVPGCSYLDPWVTPAAAPPSPLCAGGAARREPEALPQPLITPPPS